MITRDNITNKLLCEFLKCGYSDVEFLINLISDVENRKFKIKNKEDFLFYVDKEGEVVNMIFDKLESYTKEKDINLLINVFFEIVIDRINEIYNLNLSCDDYEIFLNCSDSHLSLIDEDFTETLTEEEQNTKDEIKAIIEHFN
ncbi:MAG TPA: hypothetical protein ENG87_02200 [Candidatus Pacearchaeota archaeon]|nr:hypothetical protein [Candidatus Pacearchaeota archaeon]